jgi:hypothetical protein
VKGKNKKFNISKKQLLLVTVLTALVIIMATVFAVVLSKKEVENNFTNANLSVAVLEDNVVNGVATFKADGDDYTALKGVSVKNTSYGANAAQEYIRVCIIPKFMNISDDGTMQTAVMDESDNGAFPTAVSNNSYTMSGVTFNLDEAWASSWSYKNGYFYYNTAVTSGETTAKLLESVAIPKAVLDNYTQNGLKLKVVVLADAIQTVGGAVESRWADSGLASNDVARPSEETTDTSESTEGETDKSTTASALEANSHISEYDMEKASDLVSTVSVTVYELPEDGSDDTENAADDTDTENAENTHKRAMGDFEEAVETPHIVGDDAVAED